jgi:hypothetical protein
MKNAVSSLRPGGETLKSLKLEISKRLPHLKKKSVTVMIASIFRGKIKVPHQWERTFLSSLGCSDKDAARAQFPQIQFHDPGTAYKNDSLIAITFRLLPLLDQAQCSVYSTASKVLRGKRIVPRNWENPLMIALKCGSRDELTAQYSLLRFHD